MKTWENTNFYIWLEFNVLYDVNSCEFCSFTLDDYMSLDWEVYREKHKLHTFEEALAAYKCGDTIYRNSEHPDNKHNINDKIPCFFRRQDLLANDWLILDN